jgi:hypothetical protein
MNRVMTSTVCKILHTRFQNGNSMAATWRVQTQFPLEIRPGIKPVGDNRVAFGKDNNYPFDLG